MPDQLSEPEMLHRIYQGLYGVPGSDDKGLLGKVNDIDSKLDKINGAVRMNTAWRKAIIWTTGALVALLITVVAFVLNGVP